MFELPEMPSTTALLSAYTTVAASAMLIRSAINEVRSVGNQLLPMELVERIMSKIGGSLSSTMCIVINETTGFVNNEVFEAAQIYLRTKTAAPSINTLNVSKTPRENQLSVSIDRGQEITDNFNGMPLHWKLVSEEIQTTRTEQAEHHHFSSGNMEKRSFRLSFHKKFKDEVLQCYLPYLVERSKALKEESKVVRLYSLGYCGESDESGLWGSLNLDHPSTFDTLAMDPALKQELIQDLDRFLRRREFYRRVGKAWKRGYLLYGPPGTGKSSLVAAMANYLKFNIYDLELSAMHSNDELRRLLVSTKNRSIIVIEDIDCSIDFHSRDGEDTDYNRFSIKQQSQLTLSGLLNFIDGLWSSCGDQKIIVFTTNHRDKLDPALLRPGRMDMHIHMSYCTFTSFKILASNYLGIKSHCKFEDIQRLMAEVEVTPAEIAEELMKTEDVETALDKVVEFLCKKMDDKRDGVGGGEDKEEAAEMNVLGPGPRRKKHKPAITMHNVTRI